MNEEKQDKFETKIKENVFQHFYPDQQLSPKNIVDLFVKEYTEYNALTAYTHTFVFGSRGSGKTMLFKFLEPACQVIEYGSLEKFFNQPDSFIGICIGYNTGDYTKTEFCKLLADKEVPLNVSKRIIMHYFIMDIADWTLNTILGQLKQKIISDKEKEAVSKVISALDKKKIYDDIPEKERNLKTLKGIMKKEKNKTLSSIQDYQSNYGTPSNRLKYTGNFTDPSCQSGSFLYTFFDELRKLIGVADTPFFLLFDEVTEIEGIEPIIKFHQQIINTFISQRVQNLVCTKVSACHESYSTDVDINGRAIEEIHDYYVVNLDSLYTNNQENYYRRIKQIANRRLEIAQWKVNNIVEFLPENLTEINKMKKAIQYTADEYDKLPEDKKIGSKQNYINKYARARFFQKFLEKTEYGYTGFDNLVHFSSGITRAFLDACFHMVIEYRQKDSEISNRDIEFIPFEMQKNAVKFYSNSFIDTEILQPIRRRATESEERKLLEELFNLIEALGQAFKIRLDNKNSRYPRIISFSVKETLRDSRLERILHKALRECFFHKKWYRGKSGYEMLECFILNKRLCPRYKLDLSGFQGRIEISQEHLFLALDNPKKFVSWFKRRQKIAEKEEKQLPLFDM